MTLDEINKRIESGNIYKFMTRHKKVINIIQGLIIIGLLIGIQIYAINDHTIKKQIADKCGYETSTYKCICNKKYVDDYLQFENTGKIDINNISPGTAIELSKHTNNQDG